MKHLVLYRKYRPTIFKEVIDQDDIAKTLLNQINEGKVSHAYLFVGPRGTGKTTISRVLSKAVNCLNRDHGEPCNNCIACNSINESTTLDYMELDAATNNGVDDMRNLIESTQYAATLLKNKIYVIDECHMLSKGAFNALLKTLEEPKGSSIFILATTELQKIPATIISRCTKLFFKRINADAIVKNLQYVCEKEGRTAEFNALKLIAANSDGAMRDALSLLDQAFYMCSDTISEKIVSEMLGYSNNETIFELVEALFRHNYNSIVSLLHAQIQMGKDVQAILNDLTARLRDCMLLKATNGEILLDCTEDYKCRIDSVIQDFSLSDILAVISEINKISAAARLSQNSLTVVETGITLMCLPLLEADAEIPSLISRINSIEEKLQSIISCSKVITKEVVIEKYQLNSPIDVESVLMGQVITTQNSECEKLTIGQCTPSETDVKLTQNNKAVTSNEDHEPLNIIKEDDTKSIIDPFSVINSTIKQVGSILAPKLSQFKETIESLRREDVIFDAILMASEYSLDEDSKALNISTIPPIAYVLNTIYPKIEGINLVVSSK